MFQTSSRCPVPIDSSDWNVKRSSHSSQPSTPRGLARRRRHSIELWFMRACKGRAHFPPLFAIRGAAQDGHVSVVIHTYLTDRSAKAHENRDPVRYPGKERAP